MRGKVSPLLMTNFVETIWLMPLAATKIADLLDVKIEGSRPDNKIQSSRSPRSALIDEG
jgi:hypothetical protein